MGNSKNHETISQLNADKSASLESAKAIEQTELLRHAATEYLPTRLREANRRRIINGCYAGDFDRANRFLGAEDQLVDKVVINAALRGLGWSDPIDSIPSENTRR